MNQREYQRITVRTLPNVTDDLATVVRKLNSEIVALQKRDEDKEKRIRVLEDELKRATGRNSIEKLFGTKWKMVALQDGSDRLDFQFFGVGGWESAGYFSRPT